MKFFLVSWKEFVERKMYDKAEIVREEESSNALVKMQEFNAQKRLTTTDYQAFDLSALLENNSLEIVEKVVVE